jgi:hypothetical protein
MFIVWQGAGLAGVLVPILIVLLGGMGFDAALGDGYSKEHGWTMALLIALSAALVWLIGSKLNNRPGKELIDPETRQMVVLKPRHTIFWIPLQYFAIILAVLAAFVLFK